MHRYHRAFFIFCMLLQTFSKVHAQQNFFKTSSIGVQGYYGSFLTNLPKAAYLRDSYSYFAEVAVQQQTDGSQAWQQANGFPQVGVAVFFGNTGSKQYAGNMAGAFPFVNITFLKAHALQSKLRIGAGLGWVQKPYNKITNHKNILIGSHLNAYLNFLWQNEFKIAPNTYANVGASFSHLSNGSTTLPNLGLNIPALSAGIRYGITEATTAAKKMAVFNKNFSWWLFTSAGLKQFPWIQSKRYLVNVVQAETGKHFSYSDAYSFGAVMFYDRSLQVDPSGLPDKIREGNKIQLGVYASYEHSFGKLSMPLQLGAYVYNNDIYPALFQQIGFRYKITDKLQAQFLMKTHSGKADCMHFGIGYKLK